MKLLNSKTGKIQLFWDDYNWDTHTGGSKTRNTLIKAERIRAGLDDSHGFRIFIYGTGTIKTK